MSSSVNAADTAHLLAQYNAGLRLVLKKQDKILRQLARRDDAAALQHTALLIKDSAVVLRAAAGAGIVSADEIRAAEIEAEKRGALNERLQHAKVCPAPREPVAPEGRRLHAVRRRVS